MENKYIALYGLTNTGSIGIKSIEYGIEDVITWDIVTDKIIDNGISIITYTDNDCYFIVNDIKISLSECIRTTV